MNFSSTCSSLFCHFDLLFKLCIRYMHLLVLSRGVCILLYVYRCAIKYSSCMNIRSSGGDRYTVIVLYFD